MNQEYKLYRISQLLSRFKEQVKILNSNGEFSINIHAENILINILNEIYNCNLKNVNYEEGKTYPSIDLRDITGRIAIQITSTANLEKVKHTLNKFIENNLYEEFDRLFIFIITQKQEKYDQIKINDSLNGLFKFEVNQIIDRTDIYKELNSQNNLQKINSVCEILEKQFADNKPELDKWDLFCKGQFEYDQYICNLYNYLDIKGFSPKINNTLVKVCLDNIYVPLTLKLESDLEDKKEEPRKNSNKIIYTIDKAIFEFNNIVILGNPGSGKSTVLKHLARSICLKRSVEAKFDNLVPIIIKGSEFAKYVSLTSKHLSEYIIDHIDKKFELFFTKKLENNQLLVLIDGIDEINITHLRHDVVNKINSFIAQYPNNKIIVSSRIVGYKETRLNGFFYHLQVEDFDNTQIQKFIKNWYLSVSLNSDNDEDSAILKANELYKSIIQNESVLLMASNPLLVTIIALIHYQGSTLPDKRAALYEVATSTFLENWVKKRYSNKSNNFDKDLLVEILAPISFYIHKNYSTGLILEAELKSLLSNEYKKINPYISSKEEKQDVKDIIDFLREDAGFLFEKGLDENGESMFGFVHQTFQEYFTAIEFKTQWKENVFEKDLGKYVFSSNWIEVIKLTASLFKINEPSRLGRQYTTDYIKDILEVDDPYPIMYRPLKVVFQILKEDTEIEFPLFIEIINKVFDNVLNRKDDDGLDHYFSNPEVYSFRFFIKQLLITKTYQSYLIDRISKEISKDYSSILSENLIQILIESSDITLVKGELLKILNSNNVKLKERLFEYRTVLPVAEIVCTEEFRTEIVQYVNSKEFIENYKGHLPSQYNCCFERLRKPNVSRHLKYEYQSKFLEDIRNDRLLSIKSIQNEQIREDFINFQVFSIGLSSVEDIKDFLQEMKIEYPEIKLSKIEKHIVNIEKFNSYNISEYELISFKSIKIHSKNDSDSTFAFVNGKVVEFINLPFKEEDLFLYFKEDTKDFLKFLELVLPYIGDIKHGFKITSIEDLLLFISFESTLHWSVDINIQNVLSYALTILINQEGSIDKDILRWIENQILRRFPSVELEESFDKIGFKSKVLSSTLDLHIKLLLLYTFYEKNDYEGLIQPTIERLNTTKLLKEKKEINKVLHEVLW